MTGLLTLLAAVVAVLLAVPRQSGRQLPDRLSPRSPQSAHRHAVVRRLIAASAVLVATALTVSVAAWSAGGRGAVLTLSVVIGAGTALALVLAAKRQQQARRAQADVCLACGVLASYLRVGQVPSEALRLAAADSPVLGEGARVLQIGGDVGAIWRAQARRPGRDGLADLARAWEVANSTGAPLSVSLEQVAAALAADQSLRAVVAGELSAPRATGKLMAVLPLLGVGLGYVLGGDPVQWLLAGPLGWACLLGGLVLAAAGVTWIERLAAAAAVQA